MSQDFQAFVRNLDSLRSLASRAYKEASASSGLTDHPNLLFSGRMREQNMVVAILENPDLTVADFYLVRRDYEKRTGLYSDIQHSDLGLDSTNPATQTFINTFYNTVRGSDATSG